jgi:hypothetical protein
MAFLRPLLLRSYGGFVAILAREGLDSDPPTPHHPMAIGGLSLYLQMPPLPPYILTRLRSRSFSLESLSLACAGFWVGRDAYGGAARVGRLCIAYQLVTFPRARARH